MLASALVMVAMAGSAGSASAAVSFSKIVATPIAASSSCSTQRAPTPALQSGAFNDFCLALALNGGGDRELGGIPGLGDDARDMTISLAPGQIGTPRATPTCTSRRFESTSGCPAISQVGDVSAAVEGLVPLTESLLRGKIFNLEPVGTEGARLGIQIDVVLPGLPGIPAIKLESEIRLRPTDGGLDASVLNTPRAFIGIPIEMRRLGLRLWGAKADHPTLREGFVSTPTDCGAPAVTNVKIVSYGGDTTTASAAYTPTDCATLPYEQTSEVVVDGRADAPTPLTATVKVPPPAEPRVFAHAKEARVALPVGFELSPTAASAGNLEGCSDAQFDRYGSGPVQCPANSAIGEVEFDSPLLLKGAIKGPIYMGEPVPGKPLRFLATAQVGPEQDALRVKLEAVATVDQQTGQMTTTLTGLPPVPFTVFRFGFRGGPNAIVASPRACGTYTETSTTVPLSGQPATTSTSPVVIDQGCEDPGRFAPSLAASSSPTQAAADTTITTVLERPDGHARISSATVRLPPGLAGRLGAAAQCPLSSAVVGNCPAETKVGSVVATAGPGPQPLRLGGEAYLTEGSGGDPAGLTITALAKFGPLDLGKVVVSGRLTVRAADQGLNLTFANIPQRQLGISTAIRALTVTLDKPGFAVNPSSCAPQQVTATLGSDLGGTAEVAAPVQSTGCENLAFAPKLTGVLSGGYKEAAENGHPGLSTTLTQAPGEANTSRVELLMPAGIAIDSERLNRACSLATFTAGACSARSVLGKATAQTPLLSTPLAGNVTMVSVPGAPLPELRIELKGLLPITLSGKIQFGKDNRVLAVVQPVPDVPLSRFELSFNGGAESVLQTNRNMCAEANARFEGKFFSHAGKTVESNAAAEIPGCGPTGTLRVSSLRTARPSLDLRVVGARARMDRVQLVMPKGMEFQRSAIVRKRLRVSASGLKKGSRARVTITGTSIRVMVPKGQSAKVLRVRLAKGAVRASPRLRRANSALSFRLNSTQANQSQATATLRVRPGAR